jgi:hypothetical protein
MAKRKEIRNSTAEFLIFQAEDKGQGIEVIYKDENVRCTQKAMATLFNCSTDNVGLHLKNIYESGELKEEATAEKISVVRREGIELLLLGEDEHVATTIGGYLLHQHQLGEPTEAPLEGETRHRQGGQFK